MPSASLPLFMYVVPRTENFEHETYRVLDYAAYFRQVKTRLEQAIAVPVYAENTYPEPNPHCEVCRWAGNVKIAGARMTIFLWLRVIPGWHKKHQCIE